MTNQQAINVMQKYTGDDMISPVVQEAHNMAIVALKEKAEREESQARDDELFRALYKRDVDNE